MLNMAEGLDRLGALATSPIMARLGAAFAEAGFELAVVGGPVRDALLGRTTNDLDLTTNARPDDILRIVSRSRPRRGTSAAPSARSGPRSPVPPGPPSRSRSRRTGPTATTASPASRPSRSATASRTTSPGATSRSARWRCAFRCPRSWTPPVAWRTSSPASCAPPGTPTSASATIRSGCCVRPASRASSASRSPPTPSTRSRGCAPRSGS